MPVSNSGVKDRFFRIYDGTPTTPFYVELFQLEQPTLPMIEPRPTTAIQPDGGRMTDFAVTYIDNETIPFEPIEVSFRLMHMSDYLEMLDAFGNPLRKGTWEVGGDTWVGVPLASLGTRDNSDGTSVNCLYPKDVQQQSRMVNMEWKYNVPADATSGTSLVCQARGVVITNIQDMPEGQLMYFDITAQIWGQIDPSLTDFTSGTESTPS